MEIILKKANVVKQVDSEDKAKVLEAKGFVRDGTTAKNVLKSGSNIAALEKEVAELKESLTRASETIETANQRKGELEKELSETKEKLEEVTKHSQEADGKIKALEKELETAKKAGTKAKPEK